MDDNISVSKGAVDFCHPRLAFLNERPLHCPFGTGFKCLNNHDIEFSKHCIFQFEVISI